MQDMTPYASRNKYSRPICLRLPHNLAVSVAAYADNDGVTISPLVQTLLRYFFDGKINLEAAGLPGKLPTLEQCKEAAEKLGVDNLTFTKD